MIILKEEINANQIWSEQALKKNYISNSHIFHQFKINKIMAATRMA